MIKEIFQEGNDKGLATIRDIAAHCGVSRGTVDRVLNGRGHVAPGVEEKVLAAVQELDYRPNRAGKLLAGRKKSCRLAFLLCDDYGRNPYYMRVRWGIEKKAEELREYGAEVRVFSCSGDDRVRQCNILEQCVAEDCDGIALTPVDHPEVAERLRSLGERGVAVVTVGHDLLHSGRLAYVGGDHLLAGRTAAGLAALFTGGAANVGIIGGAPGLRLQSERVEGFLSQLEKQSPGLHVVQICEGGDDDLAGFSLARTLLEEQPQLDVLYVAAAGAYGAGQAVEHSGRAGQVKIICHDVLPRTTEQLGRGIVTAILGQQPEYQGGQALSVLYDHLVFGLAPKARYDCAPEIFIRENCPGERPG